MGTSEFYAIVESLPGIRDSLVVHLEDESGGPGRLLLFVVLERGTVDRALTERISTALRSALSPRHVPDEIHAVPSIPRTHSGKKLEVPIKRVLLGQSPDDVLRVGSLADPAALDAFLRFASDARKPER
jgi:acetoacetyl-CoA synthetase